MPLAHSYSAIKDFENCRRKYHEVRILKKFKQSDTEATLYGTAVHKAFEEYIRDGVPIPAQFSQFESMIAPLRDVAGELFCERKMGIRADFTPCEFFDKDVWFRAIPDYLVVNSDTKVARIVDYKTGKSSRYADTAQLELLAAMTMIYHPEVETVKGALLFVVANDIVRATYKRADMSAILSKWVGRAAAIEAALESNNWGPSKSPLCRFCPVSTCEYHQ